MLLGAVKKIRRARPELRVVICSAALDAETFLEFFIGRGKPKRRRRRTTLSPVQAWELGKGSQLVACVTKKLVGIVAGTHKAICQKGIH